MNFKSRTSQGRTLSLEQLEIWLDELDPPVAGVSSIDGFLIEQPHVWKLNRVEITHPGIPI
jgi:hypothetical protein